MEILELKPTFSKEVDNDLAKGKIVQCQMPKCLLRGFDPTHMDEMYKNNICICSRVLL